MKAPMHASTLDKTLAVARIVRVALGHRSYDVVIGPDLLPHAGQLIAQRLGARKAAIVTDRNVAAHHLATLEQSFETDGRLRRSIVLEAGEATKSFGQLGYLCERLLETGLERGDLVVALGGGVIGDLAGLAAAILRRGVRFVQIPTSLLAQVDSSVGGKTGINTPQGKNLVGAFHQPSLVVADTALLATLSGRHLCAGYAEVAKYGLLGDAAFFSWLETSWPAVMALDPQAVAHAVFRSVEMKALIVERDETETGERMLLNLGHTFGHAFEAEAGFSDRLLHGEAVAIGMMAAHDLSAALGLCPAADAARLRAHLTAMGFALDPAAFGIGASPAQLIHHMRQDKKMRAGSLPFILTRGIGRAFVAHDVPLARVEAFLQGWL